MDADKTESNILRDPHSKQQKFRHKKRWAKAHLFFECPMRGYLITGSSFP